MAKQEQQSPYFLWIDLEMTGLIPEKDKIIEIAAIITDYHLTPLATYHEVVYQPPEVVENMHPWCIKTHGESGLTAKIPDAKKLHVIEQEFLYFLKPFFPEGDNIILCGNTISQDRAFIELYMKELFERLHYRVLDVSTMKELFHRLYHQKFSKKETHRALDDIKESIEELRFYLSFIDLKNLSSPADPKDL